ncbi:hypothetical protein GGX14DRAFT_580967 [Mycena pura]|uniref:Uncharacterized protein n=1 Tax=Mycena pura TaxID=153505 RepID=A0AAD6XVD2_9AGAR|nr:hypothetical protein GGX14DRAFT_580967 [Mycena pura]
MPTPLAYDLQVLVSRLADLDIVEADPIIQDQIMALSQVLAAKSSALAAARLPNNASYQNNPQAFQDLYSHDTSIPDNTSLTMQSLCAEAVHRRQCADPGKKTLGNCIRDSTGLLSNEDAVANLKLTESWTKSNNKKKEQWDRQLAADSAAEQAANIAQQKKAEEEAAARSKRQR